MDIIIVAIIVIVIGILMLIITILTIPVRTVAVISMKHFTATLTGEIVFLITTLADIISAIGGNRPVRQCTTIVTDISVILDTTRTPVTFHVTNQHRLYAIPVNNCPAPITGAKQGIIAVLAITIPSDDITLFCGQRLAAISTQVIIVFDIHFSIPFLLLLCLSANPSSPVFQFYLSKLPVFSYN
jgi:hypothetical protein